MNSKCSSLCEDSFFFFLYTAKLHYDEDYMLCACVTLCTKISSAISGHHKQVTVKMENGARKMEIRSNTRDGEGVIKLDAYEFRHLKDIEETIIQVELFFHQVCIIQLWTFYSVNMVWYLMNLTVLTEAEPRSILSNLVNIRPYLLSKKSITVLLYSETIYEL